MQRLLKTFIEAYLQTIDKEEEQRSIYDDMNDQESDTLELSPHLKDTSADEEDDFGPVPPSDENDPWTMRDPFVRDY